MIILYKLLTDLSVFCAASDCIVSHKRFYGESFQLNISENAFLLEFSPRGAPAEALPAVLWNRSDPEASNAGRGRLEQGGKLWVAEGVSQADQGNYIVRNANGNVLSHSSLIVLGETEEADAELIGCPWDPFTFNAYAFFSPSVHYPATSALFPFQSFDQGVCKPAPSRFQRHPHIHPYKELRV